MATYTITTPVNIDSLTGKTGGDIYNINGGYLTIDQDSRIGLNQTTVASIAAITLSATLGGTVEINSTLVRVIPYNTGSGTVPAFNTAISRGGASGLLIGVYADLASASVNTGGAMPASGFIKIKQWNETAYSAGVLTGISATATGVDVPGWLEIVGDQLGTCTVNRLNLFRARGDYFALGTTDGLRATTYQIPSSGTLQYHAGVEVETAVGSGIYEFYPCAGTITALLASIATDGVRGKVCWISTAGLLRFGNDGTNSTGGFIPVTGLRVRIANIFMPNCTTAARAANALPNATLASRFEFATTGGGVIDMDKCSTSWFLNFQQPYSVLLSNMGICTGFVAAEIASPIVWDNVNVGQEAANSQFGLVINSSFAGGTLTNCNIFRTSQGSSGFYTTSFSDINGFDFINCAFVSGTKAGNASTGSVNLVRGVDCTFLNTKLGGGRLFMTTCTDVTVTDTVYYDHPALNTLAAFPMNAFDVGTNCLRITMNGLTFGGLNLVQPYSGLLNVAAAGCSAIRLRNVGTYETPLSLGSPRRDDQAWSRVTTVATVTSVDHGFATSDTIFVVVSSDTGAITTVAKTITSTPTADTFTFVSLNAGATSGTLSYFGTKCGNVFTLASGSNANDVRIQRVFAPHTRLNLYTTDNSAKNITMENVFSDYLNAPLIAMLNGFSKGVSGTPPLTAQIAVYGTHWFNGYVCDVADNTIAQSYSRTTTTVIVTSVGHSLRTGMLITVNPSAATTTFTADFYSVTALTSDTFRITVANAGAASGSLDYRVANGRIGLVMNEATTDTADRYTINSGTPAFTSLGGLYMPTVGDQITFTTPNYLIGQGSTFPIFEPIIGLSILARYDFQYALDKNDGNGYGPFRNMYYGRVGGAGANGAFTFTVTDATGVEIGDHAWGTGVSPWAKVTDIVANTITVDRANISTVTGTIRFNHLPNETALGPESGIKMQWRITTVTANTVAITSLYIQTDSTVAGRAFQYPLDTINLTLTGLKIESLWGETGSDIVVYAAGTETVLDSKNNVNSYVYTYETPVSVDIGVFKKGYVPFYIRGYSLENSDAVLPVAQIIDRAYLD